MTIQTTQQRSSFGCWNPDAFCLLCVYAF